jgi:predicted ArsR family transcriptional regulator
MLKQEEGSTRRQVLQLLKTMGSCNVSELSRALGITEMAVRRHIGTLERDGLVRSSLVRQAMGRPLYRYSLTERADDLFPKNYPQLALDLLAELEEQTGGSEWIGRMFEGRRDKLKARYMKRMEGKALGERVAELADIQNSGGYMADWEPSEEADRYVLHEYNCPIAQVAQRYRQACQCERRLFADLLDADVERTECLADGGARCTYVIRRNAASRQ